ncbi:MAG: hypothetical protein ACFB0C_06720 [Leptolyngbyaceae cyanobacterium]
MGFTEQLNKANGRLKLSKLKVRVAVVGEKLYCRGTFPPPPGSAKEQPYQQRIALGLPANGRGLELAEKRARDIGTDLENKRFDWADWRGDRAESVGEWVSRFESQWSGKPDTWETNYAISFRRLPQDDALTIELIKQTLEATTEADTRARLRDYDAYRQLLTLAGLDPSPLKPLKGKYSASAVDPRSLPKDEDVAAWRQVITDPGWQWVYGMIAAYGLRPHEVYQVDLLDFPTVRVPDSTKTGERFVWPLFPEWAERWALSDRHLPAIAIEGCSNRKLGAKTSKFFQRMEGVINSNAYDLRHCYARRCFEFGYSPEFGAKMMGHSAEVHCRTYRRWIDESTYFAIYQKGIDGERPTAP